MISAHIGLNFLRFSYNKSSARAVDRQTLRIYVTSDRVITPYMYGYLRSKGNIYENAICFFTIYPEDFWD